MSIVHVTFSGKHFTRTQTLFCDKSRIKMYSSKDIFLTQAFELYEKEKLKNVEKKAHSLFHCEYILSWNIKWMQGGWDEQKQHRNRSW